MPSDHGDRAGLFPALLKHWRGLRGMSQLDLAGAADVSSRHISFLETGRAAPSAEMVLRLAAALDVPLRQANAMLRAAGHEAAFSEPGLDHGLPPEIAEALRLLKAQHEPLPLVIIDRGYDVVDMNEGAMRLFTALLPPDATPGPERLNLARLTFDPEGAARAVINFDEVGRALLWRIQREVLAEPENTPLHQLLDELLAMPTVAEGWREVSLTTASSPALVVHLRVGEHELRFLTMVTAFQAPQQVLLDELRIETWLPADAATVAACHALAAAT